MGRSCIRHQGFIRLNMLRYEILFNIIFLHLLKFGYVSRKDVSEAEHVNIFTWNITNYDYEF